MIFIIVTDKSTKINLNSYMNFNTSSNFDIMSRSSEMKRRNTFLYHLGSNKCICFTVASFSLVGCHFCMFPFDIEASKS